MTIINKSNVANSDMPANLWHFITLLNRKYGDKALLEIHDEGNIAADKRSDSSVVVKVFRYGDYCGLVRQVGALLPESILLIRNNSIKKQRTPFFQYDCEASTTKFGINSDNAYALKLAVNNLMPVTMKETFEELARKISEKYNDILSKLRITIASDSNKLISEIVRERAGAMGLGTYYNSQYETYVMMAHLAEKMLLADKDGMLDFVKTIFSNDVSIADDFFYKYEKLVQFENARSKDYGNNKVFVKELRDNSIRVIYLNEMYGLLAAIKGSSNGHDAEHAEKNFWSKESKRYAITYSNLHALPEDLFTKIATLKAAGEDHHIRDTGVMMDSESWLLESVE